MEAWGQFPRKLKRSARNKNGLGNEALPPQTRATKPKRFPRRRFPSLKRFPLANEVKTEALPLLKLWEEDNANEALRFRTGQSSESKRFLYSSSGKRFARNQEGRGIKRFLLGLIQPVAAPAALRSREGQCSIGNGRNASLEEDSQTEALRFRTGRGMKRSPLPAQPKRFPPRAGVKRPFPTEALPPLRPERPSRSASLGTGFPAEALG